MSKDITDWIYSLRTVLAWSKLYNTNYAQAMMLHVGIMDHYAELCILSRILDRKIPSWVVKHL